jgi:hypothetical protein
VLNIIRDNVNLTTQALKLLQTDASQDEVINEANAQRIAEIIIGLAAPLPLSGRPAAVASFVQHEGAGPAEGHDVPVAVVSFWFQDDPDSVEVTDQDINPAMASYWFMDDSDGMEITDQDVFPPFASYWFQSPVPPADDGDVVQQGTPSYDRQQ